VNERRGSATQRGYGSAWQRTAKAVLAAHRRAHGDWCPGWQRPAHPAKDLTVDHKVPKARGGTDDPDNLWALCRACNSTKGSG
jgi:5-methylcytosine-specific restriction protein A